MAAMPISFDSTPTTAFFLQEYPLFTPAALRLQGHHHVGRTARSADEERSDRRGGEGRPRELDFDDRFLARRRCGGHFPVREPIEHENHGDSLRLRTEYPSPTDDSMVEWMGTGKVAEERQRSRSIAVAILSQMTNVHHAH